MTRRHTTRMIAAALTMGLLAGHYGTHSARADASEQRTYVPVSVAGTAIRFRYTVDPGYGLPSQWYTSADWPASTLPATARPGAMYVLFPGESARQDGPGDIERMADTATGLATEGWAVQHIRSAHLDELVVARAGLCRALAGTTEAVGLYRTAILVVVGAAHTQCGAERVRAERIALYLRIHVSRTW